MARNESQKLAAIRKRVSYLFWRDVLDQLTLFKDEEITESEVMSIIFENADKRQLFKSRQQANWEIESLYQVMLDYDVEIKDAPSGWNWKPAENN